MARRYARPGLSAREYFQHYAHVTDHGLEWAGPMNGRYGRMAHSSAHMYAHRFSWTFFRGPLADSEIVDHIYPKCPKTCITPGHLAIQESGADHTRTGWARGEYAENWATRKPVPQDQATGKFVKVES